MEEDSDTDIVLLEGSPLYELFKSSDVDFGEFETTAKISSKKDQPIISTIKKNPISSATLKFNESPILIYIRNLFLSLIHKQSNFSLNLPIYKLLLDNVFESKFLYSTDKLLLEDFREEYDYKKPSELFSHSHHLIVISVSILACFFLYGYDILPTPISVFIMLLILCLVTFLICNNIITSLMSRKKDSFINEVNDFLSNLTEFWKTIRKGLRVVQESELIARGLTFATVRNSSLDMNTVLPSRFPEKQCPELRALLFKSCRHIFLSCREGTLHLLKHCTVMEGVDIESHYLCNLEESELGPLIETDLKTDQIKQVTENYSILALKAIIELAYAQQSEYLRRIVLCFFSETNPNKIYPNVNLTANKIKKLTDTSINGLEKVLLHYTRLGQTEKISPEMRYSLEGPAKIFRTSIRSLSLHLQAALIRLQNLEGSLEKVENEELSHIREIIRDDGNKCLTEIKSELEAANVCYEESVLRSLELLDAVPKKLNLPIVTSEVNVKPKTSPINLFEMGDPVIEDQVFEGSAEYIENEDHYDEFPASLPKKAPGVLLNELKTVLAVKAEERKIREAKALGIDLSEIPDTLDLPEKYPKDNPTRGVFFLPNKTIDELNLKAKSASSPMMTSIAAQAALKSQLFGLNQRAFKEELIGDSDSDTDTSN